jgi:hypothetical protein
MSKSAWQDQCRTAVCRRDQRREGVSRNSSILAARRRSRVTASPTNKQKTKHDRILTSELFYTVYPHVCIYVKLSISLLRMVGTYIVSKIGKISVNGR